MGMKNRLESDWVWVLVPQVIDCIPWTSDMPSLRISFLICREGHACLLGRVSKESLNTGIGHQGLASTESHCQPTGAPREEPWVGTPNRICKSSRLPLPNTGRWYLLITLSVQAWVGWCSLGLSGEGVHHVFLDGTVSWMNRQHDMNPFSPLTHCSVGRRFVHCLFRQPACWRKGKPDRHCPANSVPPVHAYEEPHGHHHTTSAPCRTWGAESSWAPSQEGADVPIHLPCPDEGMCKGHSWGMAPCFRNCFSIL